LLAANSNLPLKQLAARVMGFGMMLEISKPKTVVQAIALAPKQEPVWQVAPGEVGVIVPLMVMTVVFAVHAILREIEVMILPKILTVQQVVTPALIP
ncbi:unnamed protein product, partial [marine sediment metagenome]